MPCPYRNLLLFALLLYQSFATAGELQIAVDRQSDYQIVIPQQTEEDIVGKTNRKAAQLLADSLKECSGACLPIHTEDQMTPGKPGLFIGKTRALQQAGLADLPLEIWEHRIQTHGKDVFLFGYDAAGKVWRDSGIFGSLKAVLTFLEQYAGAVYSGSPEPHKAVKSGTAIRLPEPYSYRKIPVIRYCISRGKDLFYDTANNFFAAPWYCSGGGHSHDKAIPFETYRDTHPEYFILKNGKRQIDPKYPNYCFSNPEVQALIYQQILTDLDQGFTVTEVGQADGFNACECQPCRQMFAVEDPAEKIWIMHRDMALRLLKDRPGATMQIMAYGPTANPPSTFNRFPENVCIELAHLYWPGVLENWKKIQVPGGFTTYSYNWGHYQIEGFTPKLTLSFLAQQAALFNQYPIRGIYRCGFGELFGLEGPAYYAWGKMLDNPQLKPDDLLERYCQAVFGSAADDMRKFYLCLDQALAAWKGSREPDWNDRDVISGKSPLMRENLEMYSTRYPESVLQTMEQFLIASERKTSCPLLTMARYEFDYLKATARAVNAYVGFLKNPHAEGWLGLQKAIEARREYIASLPVEDNGINLATLNSFRLFARRPKEELDRGSRMGPLGAPFDWDFEQFARKKILPPSGRQMRPDGQWHYLLRGESNNRPEPPPEPLMRVSCQLESESLCFTFVRNVPQSQFIVNGANDWYEINLGPGEENLRSFKFAPALGKIGSRSLEKNNGQNQGNGLLFSSCPASAHPEMIYPAGIPELQPGETAFQLRIPFKLLPHTPAPGEQWQLNILWGIPGFSPQVWEYNFAHRSWRNVRDQFGTLLFTKP